MIKLGEALEVQITDIHSDDAARANPIILNRMADDSELLEHFKKVAAELKKIAPKATDFLYFSAIMMHSAEASLLDHDGKIRVDADGEPLTASWKKSGESWKWVCSDKKLQPYKNSNADIFPEEELIKAHKKWIGRPLCLDHKSSSVDMIRGVIVDTYYDYKCKRVVALCALDKVNYPDLARKVSTGYATSVSMGTAVGKAICSDCGKVARVEADFCDHMRNKSCYGEINVNLSPIELSIVVNGADPNAKIRHIVAAANSLARYVDTKKSQLTRLAEDEKQDIELASDVEQGLDKLMQDVGSLKEKIQKLRGNEEAEQKRHEESGADQGQADVAAVADNDLTISSAANTLQLLINRVEELDKKLNKLSSFNEELQMTTKQGYFQGAGGVNEPTPGKPKYEKEDAESIRNSKDKQMESPQDTGPVTGLFPGDEQKKKELQRIAQAEEARLRREAALTRAKDAISTKKEGYWQGAGGVNEPTPNKPKYPKEDAEKIREKEDKQMNGAPPFPGVGKLDGLYDKDLETKKKLLRASLKAKFIKAARPDGSQDLGNSCWQVFADDKLIMTATVSEITGNRAESLYSSIATRDFGRELISKIKTDGFDKAASLFKAAQEIPSPSPAAAPPMGAGSDPMTPPPGDGPALDKGGSGNPKEMIPELIRQCQNHLSDLSLAFEALTNEPSNELDGLGDLAEAPMGSAATVNLVGTQKKLSKAIRMGIKQISTDLKDHVEELKLAGTIINDTVMMKNASTERKEAVASIAIDACADARRTIADAIKLMGAVVKYSRGTQSLVKRAKKEMEMNKSAQVLEGIGESSPQVEKSLQGLPGHDKRVNPTTGKSESNKGGKWYADGTNMYWDGSKYVSAPMAAAKPAVVAPGKPAASPVGVGYSGDAGEQNLGVMSPEARGKALQMGGLKGLAPDAAHGVTAPDAAGHGSKMPGKPGDMSVGAHSGDADAHADDGMANDVTVTKQDGTKVEMGSETAKEVLKGASFDLGTLEGRSAYRAKLAKEMSMPAQKELAVAHPGGGFTTKLEVKPSGDLAKVETLDETHKAMLDIANAPPRVRKAAEQIEQYVKAGKIDPSKDFPGLVSQGLDGDAVKYWKQFYSQAKDGGSQFAAELVKEHASQKVAEEKESYKVKVARAYGLAYEMVEREMISREASAVSEQVNAILTYSDDQFDSMKRLVSRQSIQKKASAMPLVGMIGSDEITIPAPQAEPSNLRGQLESLWANKRY